MDDYQNNSNDLSSSNPWADLENVAPKNNSQANIDRRVISRPDDDLPAQSQPAINNQDDLSLSLNQPPTPQATAQPMQPSAETPQPQPVQTTAGARFENFADNNVVFPPEKVEPVGKFDNIAWGSDGKGMEDFSTNLNQTVPAQFSAQPSPNLQPQQPAEQQPVPQNLGQEAAVQNPPVSQPMGTMPAAPNLQPVAQAQSQMIQNPDLAAPGAVPKPDTLVVSDRKKSKIPKLKLKMPKINLKIILIILGIILFIAGGIFGFTKLKGGSSNDGANKSDQQLAAEDIINLARENKSDQIIEKYVRASNKESFPSAQFKSSVQQFSESTSGKPVYSSENTAQVIVKPDTTPSNMAAYIYTTGFKGYKGKIYIRVDVFQDATDGKWYMYAFAYNSKELKADISP